MQKKKTKLKVITEVKNIQWADKKMTGSNMIWIAREVLQTIEAAMEWVVFIGKDNDREQEGRIFKLKKEVRRKICA